MNKEKLEYINNKIYDIVENIDVKKANNLPSEVIKIKGYEEWSADIDDYKDYGISYYYGYFVVIMIDGIKYIEQVDGNDIEGSTGGSGVFHYKENFNSIWDLTHVEAEDE